MIKSELTNQELIMYIEKYENRPLMRNIFVGNTGFEKEVENFYDLGEYLEGR